jgi:RNA polymerase sigma-70 factor (ECF subfamily)
MSIYSIQFDSKLSMFLHQLADAYHSTSSVVAEKSTTSDPWSDEALVEAIVKRGSQQHFRTLMARYKTKVHHLSLSVLGPSQQHQAEDVAQEVFLKLYQRLESFRGDCKFSTWLYRLAINTAIDFKRKNNKFIADNIDEVSLPEAMSTAAFSPEDHDKGQRIQKAVQELPQTQSIMIYQYYWLGLKTREIADVLDCPEGTVKVYLLRARKALAEQLGVLRNA